MKYIVITFLIALLTVSLSTQSVFASSAYVQTNTTIQGSGSVTTHIQTTANGETKTLDTNDQGEHDVSVENNDDSNQEEETGTITITPIPTETPEMTETPASTTAHAAKEQKHTILDMIRSFFSNLTHLFHFA